VTKLASCSPSSSIPRTVVRFAQRAVGYYMFSGIWHEELSIRDHAAQERSGLEQEVVQARYHWHNRDVVSSAGP
jgi:hypothetical protein